MFPTSAKLLVSFVRVNSCYLLRKTVRLHGAGLTAPNRFDCGALGPNFRLFVFQLKSPPFRLSPLRLRSKRASPSCEHSLACRACIRIAGSCCAIRSPLEPPRRINCSFKNLHTLTQLALCPGATARVPIESPGMEGNEQTRQAARFLSHSSMPRVRINATAGTSWPCRAIRNASKKPLSSTIPSELLSMVFVISVKWDCSPAMAVNGVRTTNALRFLFKTSSGTIPTSARRIRERLWPGRTSCSLGIAKRNSSRSRSR